MSTTNDKNATAVSKDDNKETTTLKRKRDETSNKERKQILKKKKEDVDLLKVICDNLKVVINHMYNTHHSEDYQSLHDSKYRFTLETLLSIYSRAARYSKGIFQQPPIQRYPDGPEYTYAYMGLFAYQEKRTDITDEFWLIMTMIHNSTQDVYVSHITPDLLKCIDTFGLSLEVYRHKYRILMSHELCKHIQTLPGFDAVKSMTFPIIRLLKDDVLASR